MSKTYYEELMDNIDFERVRNLVVSYEKAYHTKSVLMAQYAVTKNVSTRNELYEILEGLSRIQKLIIEECCGILEAFQCNGIVYHIIDRKMHRLDLGLIRKLT